MSTMLYRSGTKHKIWGIDCDYQVFEPDEASKALDDGWVKSPLDLKPDPVPEQGSEYESELRARIKALGGKAGGRASIATLERQLAELEGKEDGDSND